MTIYFRNIYVNLHVSMWTSFRDTIPVAAISYAAALVVCMMVESSSMGLEKLLLRRGPPPQAK